MNKLKETLINKVKNTKVFNVNKVFDIKEIKKQIKNNQDIDYFNGTPTLNTLLEIVDNYNLIKKEKPLLELEDFTIKELKDFFDDLAKEEYCTQQENLLFTIPELPNYYFLTYSRFLYFDEDEYIYRQVANNLFVFKIII